MAERDKDFGRFHDSLKRRLAVLGLPPPGSRGHSESQRTQVEHLAAIEITLRDTLIAHPWGPTAYRGFVRHVCEERKNILAARPYFRERQVEFAGPISDALKARDWKKLQVFHPNFNFFKLVLSGRKWQPGSKIAKLMASLLKARDELVTANIPLAINRGHVFYGRAVRARSSLSSMDILDIFAEGLISGTDKYGGDWSPKWRAVAIGRMLGYAIEANSETCLHFYPNDRRRIYRANKARAASPDATFESILENVNRGIGVEHEVNPSELAELMSAASAPTSSDSPIDDDGRRSLADTFAAPDYWRPDVAAEQRERLSIARSAIECLTVFERKLLAIKTGVDSL